MQDMQALVQQSKLKNLIADYIRALQEERERLRRIRNPQGIIDSLNLRRMSIFDRENFNNIDNNILELDNAINTLNGLLGNSNELSVENLQNTMNEINQNQPYAMKTIEAIGRTKRNQIAVTILGAAVVGLSIAIAVLTFGAATPLMIGLDTAFFAVGMGATVWGSKSIHDRKKALLELKIAKEIMPTKSEIILYPKMIRDILLQAKGDNEFTSFQKDLYRQVDKEYDLRKKIEEGTELTRTEKFFHKRKIRRILQQKINSGKQLSEYEQGLYDELFPTNQENETDTGTEDEIETNEEGIAIFSNDENSQNIEIENPLYNDQNYNTDDPFAGDFEDESSTQPTAKSFDESSTSIADLAASATEKSKKHNKQQNKNKNNGKTQPKNTKNNGGHEEP